MKTTLREFEKIYTFDLDGNVDVDGFGGGRVRVKEVIVRVYSVKGEDEYVTFDGRGYPLKADGTRDRRSDRLVLTPVPLEVKRGLTEWLGLPLHD